MSNAFSKVKELITRLFRDASFQDTMTNGSVEERRALIERHGYQFEQSQFEEAAIEMMEAKERGELEELSHDELAFVFGGFVKGIEPIDIGGCYPRPIKWPPIGPGPIAMYGVIIPRDEFLA